MSRNKVGRPKEDLSSLPKEWYNDVLALYSEGGNDSDVKCYIKTNRGSFSNNLWYRWMKDFPEFYNTIKKGRTLSNGQGLDNISKNREKKLSHRRKIRDSRSEYESNRIAYSQRSLLNYHIRTRGLRKSKSTFNIFGYSPEELVNDLSKKLVDGMTLDNYGEWHVDHIKPLSLFDLTCEDEIRKAWDFDNLQPLWALDNLRKSNHYEE